MIISSYMKKKNHPSSSSPANCNNVVHETLSKFLRRILCFNTLPWSPFDHLRLHHHQQRQRLLEDHNQEKKNGPGTTTPGLVARLMGLETLPRNHPEDSSSSEKKSRIITRKDITAYEELEEDDEFYILRFENKRLRRRRRTTTTTRRERNDMENEGIITKTNGNPPLKDCFYSGCKKKSAEGIETTAAADVMDCSENSSPNSVLEFVEFPAADDQTTASSGGDNSRVGKSKMRRTLSDELQNCGNPKSSVQKNNLRSRKQESNLITNNNNRGLQIHADDHQLTAAGKLAGSAMWIEEGVFKNHNQNQQCWKEIGRDVASEILDHLIMDELVTMIFST